MWVEQEHSHILRSMKAATIIPVKDATWLRAAVESAVSQSAVVVIDDDSGSNLAELLAGLDVTVIKSDGRGVCAARNLGIEWALSRESDWIQFLDADDELPARKIGKQVSGTELHSVGSWCDVMFMNEAGNGHLQDLSRLDLAGEVSRGFVPQTGSFLFAAESLVDIRWNENLDRNTTLDFVRRHITAGHHFNHVPDVHAAWWPQRGETFKRQRREQAEAALARRGEL